MKKLYFLLSFAMFSLLANAQEPFISTWNIDETDLTITFPITEETNNNYTIDFGDGTILTNQTGPATHTYTSSGLKTITVSGSFQRIDFYTLNEDSEHITSLDQWGDNEWTSMENAFHGCSNLTINATDIPDLSQVTDISGMLRGCSHFGEGVSINGWDVSNVTNMSYLFAGISSFNLPINDWDVSNVTNMEFVFYGSTAFNQPISNWDVSNVTSMRGMFFFAEAFNQPINNWDVSNVVTMDLMFSTATHFNQPVNDWDVSNVTNMESMFSRSGYNQPLDSWDVSNVTNMRTMFSQSGFNQPINTWNVSNVTNMNSMFDRDYQFNQPLNNWDISNVTDIKLMFNSSASFNQDISVWNFNTSLYFEPFGSNYGFIKNSGLDVTNYEAFLIKCIQLGFENRTLKANGLEYCDPGIRNYLIEQLDWDITGDNQGLECQLNTITGSVTFDDNNNGCDIDDQKINNIIISANDGQNTNTTVSMGDVYDLTVTEGSYTVQLLNVPDYFTVTPQTSTIDFTGFDNEQELNFCLTANEQVTDLNITVLPLNEARPGFTSQYRLLVHNIGTQTINDVYASFSYNEEIQQFSEASQETSSATDNELTFSLGSISPFESKFIDITMETFAPPTVEGGEIISFNATVTPDTNDNTPNDNNFSFNQPVVNSFDPNDKKVVQGEEIYIEKAGEYLDYIIRFQNTGSASAITVRIEDVLHENLDWNTFTPITASHNYRVEITDGNQVSFIFDDIYLPHEDADEEGSHGFVAYKIKPVQDIEIGDMITGTAGIYFDYNLPIITNSANTEVIELLGLNDFSLNSITVYPNPAKSILNIQTDGNTSIEGISIYNIEGREILNVKEQTESINIQNLSEGVYFMNIQTNKGISKHKLIKN